MPPPVSHIDVKTHNPKTATPSVSVYCYQVKALNICLEMLICFTALHHLLIGLVFSLDKSNCCTKKELRPKATQVQNPPGATP